jgi:hypothetical protein
MIVRELSWRHGVTSRTIDFGRTPAQDLIVAVFFGIVATKSISGGAVDPKGLFTNGRLISVRPGAKQPERPFGKAILVAKARPQKTDLVATMFDRIDVRNEKVMT